MAHYYIKKIEGLVAALKRIRDEPDADHVQIATDALKLAIKGVARDDLGPEWIDTKATAKILGIAVKSLSKQRAIKKSPLPYVKVKNNVFYKEEDVRRYARWAAQERKSAQRLFEESMNEDTY